MEWYDGDRPEPYKNNNPEAIGEWVRRQRAERKGIPTESPAASKEGGR